MKLLTVTIVPYDVTAVPTVLHWKYSNGISFFWNCFKLGWAMMRVYKTTKVVPDELDTDKVYLMNKDGDVLLSISIEETPTSYDHQLALSV